MKTVIAIVVAIIILVLICATVKTENLSLSQFPIPTCSTCKSCRFYSCGKCGTVYQEQNKEGQACDCGGFTAYRTRVEPSCYTQTLKGGPTAKPVSCYESFGLPATQPNPPVKGSCASCRAGEHVCLQAAGTFDSGSTFLRNVPCPVPFPRVLPAMSLVAQKQMRHVSELDIFQHLQAGGLIVGANDGKIADYAVKKLIDATMSGGQQGTPNFYYIQGPVVIMNKVNDDYFWMIDYPIKYSPANMENYVNTSQNWNIAKTMWNTGRKLLNRDAPIFFFMPSAASKQQLCASAFSCQPQGVSQSTTDYYYPGCTSRSCLWGPDYGSGNWLTRV